MRPSGLWLPGWLSVYVCSYKAQDPCGNGHCVNDGRGLYRCLCSEPGLLKLTDDGDPYCPDPSTPSQPFLSFLSAPLLPVCASQGSGFVVLALSCWLVVRVRMAAPFHQEAAAPRMQLWRKGEKGVGPAPRDVCRCATTAYPSEIPSCCFPPAVYRFSRLAQRGDTCEGVASWYNVNLRRFKEMNLVRAAAVDSHLYQGCSSNK